MSEPTPTPTDSIEDQKKKDEKKKQKEAEKEAKLAKLAEKEAKAKLLKEKEEENRKKKQAKEQEEKEALEKEANKLREYAEKVKKTPLGEKKDMSGELFPSYHPPAVESCWYEWWQKNEFFSPETQLAVQPHVQKDKKFVIVIPPPNVTGSLHLGHALTNSIQDAIVRFHRMKGEVCLWVPGTDHAGIATQVVVEKKLMREKKITRHDIGREQFVAEVWKWKDEYGSRIQNQLKKLASSLDWKREAFTMDETRSRAVTTAFVRMFNDGLIVRSKRLVNWSCTLKTAISDIEVDYLDLEKHTRMSVPGHTGQYDFGVLFEFAYPVDGSDSEQLIVATTRIETMLADTAVAVHPDDVRYKHLHGKHVIHPIHGTKLPIITDAVLVDPTFGTGVVKITPAHDPNDYETGVRHNLPMINLFTDEGLINENGGELFKGMKRFDCRTKIIEVLEKKGLYKGMKDNKMRIGVCSRSKDIIEPLVKPQWYVKCDGMAARAVAAVKEGELEIIPSMHEVTWFRWLEGIKDWCISRQLWWGHRIPAYLVKIAGRPESDPFDMNSWVVSDSQDSAIDLAATRFNVARDQITLEQDPDVLDTWFSSGLFPFSTLGWPENTTDMQNFYPTSLLETGSDILFFWVARMVMMGQQLTGKLPFKQVFLHAMVRDSHGRKMSKSLGNVIDPIDVIRGISLKSLQDNLKLGNLEEKEFEKASAGLKSDYPTGIPECGTDALRFALCAYTSQGRDINLDILRVDGYRRFCNKIWNASRFALMKLGADYKPIAFDATGLVANASSVNAWILNAAARAIRTVEQGFKEYDFAAATTAIYTFWLHELCDFYLETTKPIFTDDYPDAEDKLRTKHTLYTCIEIGLKLLHSFMPFITEELYQALPRRPLDTISTIMLSAFPAEQPSWINSTIEDELRQCQDLITSVRALCNKYKVRKIPVYLHATKPETFEIYNRHAKLIKVLVQASSLEVYLGAGQRPGCVVDTFNESLSILLDIATSIDIGAEIKRLEGSKTQLTAAKEALLKKINIPTYDKVPSKIREDNSNKLKSLEEEIQALELNITSFLNLGSK